MTYNYMPQGSIFEDIDGQLYCEVDLLKGIKRPLDRAEIVSNYQPKSCLIENKDGEIFNLIDLLLSVGQSTTQPPVDLQEVIDARTNYWGEEFETLKERLDADYKELAKDLEISRHYPYSGTGELSEIKHTADGIVKGLYIEGNTINENGVRKSVGEESNKINILSKNSDGSKTSSKEILLPFNGGLKSLNGVCDVVEDREDGIYVIQRISEDYQVLATPVEHKVAERDLNIDTYQDVTYVECENSIKPKISFVANGRVYEGQDVKVDGSKDGEVKNMLIKGQTYQNIINNFSKNWTDRSEVTILSPTKINIQSDGVKPITFSTIKKNLPLLKSNTLYTAIALISNNTLSGGFNLIHSYYDMMLTKNRVAVAQNFNGLIKGTFTTIDDLNSPTASRIEINIPENTIGEVTIENLIILEGDWTNKEVPSSIDGIESVGDKEGNKISILSRNKNLLDIDRLRYTSSNITGLVKDKARGRVEISYKDKSAYPYVSYELTDEEVNFIRGKKILIKSDLIQYDSTLNHTIQLFATKADGSTNWITSGTTVPMNVKTVRLQIHGHNNSSNVDVVGGTTIYENIYIGIEEMGDTYIPQKINKKEILLPIDNGLKSLPDGTCDTVEQREDGVYLVQKVGKVIFDGSRNEWWLQSINSNDIANFTINTISHSESEVYCDKFVYDGNFIADVTQEGVFNNGFSFYIRINKSKADTVEKFKTWLQANPTTVYYELATPIETKLFDDLETFKNSTYLSFENVIKPEYIECEIPYNVDALVNGLLQENRSLQNANLLITNELEETKGQLEENNNEQIATQLDLDMRLMMLEMGDL